MFLKERKETRKKAISSTYPIFCVSVARNDDEGCWLSLEYPRPCQVRTNKTIWRLEIADFTLARSFPTHKKQPRTSLPFYYLHPCNPCKDTPSPRAEACRDLAPLPVPLGQSPYSNRQSEASSGVFLSRDLSKYEIIEITKIEVSAVDCVR